MFINTLVCISFLFYTEDIFELARETIATLFFISLYVYSDMTIEK